MQLTVFLVEVILIFFYLEWEKIDKYIEPSTEQYSSYYSTDIIGNDIIEFSSLIKEPEKIRLLNDSSLMEEVANYVPKMEIMSEIFNNGVEDKSDFKEIFIAYMESLHFQYLGQEITIEEFRDKIAHPKNIHVLD